jgi:hypothetical protein
MALYFSGSDLSSMYCRNFCCKECRLRAVHASRFMFLAIVPAPALIEEVQVHALCKHLPGETYGKVAIAAIS